MRNNRSKLVNFRVIANAHYENVESTKCTCVILQLCFHLLSSQLQIFLLLFSASVSYKDRWISGEGSGTDE